MSTSPITRAKDKYKIKKWQAYNKSLCRRGSLTLWLEASVMKEWEHLSGKKKEVGDGQKSLNRTGLHDPRHVAGIRYAFNSIIFHKLQGYCFNVNLFLHFKKILSG